MTDQDIERISEAVGEVTHQLHQLQREYKSLLALLRRAGLAVEHMEKVTHD